jgi:polyisoprenoid-binding protein YceI
MKLKWPNITIVLCMLIPASAQTLHPMQIDTEKSVMRVHVFKSGLLSAFGHEHEIIAPIESGSLSEQPSMVELTVNARMMKVEDKDVSDQDRAEIQQTMLGPKVLDSEQFPQIRFHSTQLKKLAENKWQAEGELSLHGQTRPVRLLVSNQNGAYKGSTELKQKDFGITPVTAGGGSVRTKNELRVEYEIYIKSGP